MITEHRPVNIDHVPWYSWEPVDEVLQLVSGSGVQLQRVIQPDQLLSFKKNNGIRDVKDIWRSKTMSRQEMRHFLAREMQSSVAWTTSKSSPTRTKIFEQFCLRGTPWTLRVMIFFPSNTNWKIGDEAGKGQRFSISGQIWIHSGGQINLPSVFSRSTRIECVEKLVHPQFGCGCESKKKQSYCSLPHKPVEAMVSCVQWKLL